MKVISDEESLLYLGHILAFCKFPGTNNRVLHFQELGAPIKKGTNKGGTPSIRLQATRTRRQALYIGTKPDTDPTIFQQNRRETDMDVTKDERTSQWQCSIQQVKQRWIVKTTVIIIITTLLFG